MSILEKIIGLIILDIVAPIIVAIDGYTADKVQSSVDDLNITPSGSWIDASYTDNQDMFSTAMTMIWIALFAINVVVIVSILIKPKGDEDEQQQVQMIRCQ